MKKTIAVFLFLLAGICLHAPYTLDAQTLTWDIKFTKRGTSESLQIGRTIQMKTGEEFSISITPASDCFGYIVSYDSNREVFVLLNEQLMSGNEKYLGSFEITDPPGTETLFVIISNKKQQKLEDLIKNFNDNPGSIRNSDNLREELAKLQEEVSGLGQPGIDFVPGGGTSRGSLQEYVTRFSNKETYVRPIRIQH